MRKNALLAAAAAGALSFGLIAPAGAVAEQHIVGRASCSGGGTVRVGGTIDKDGNATALAHVWGTDRNHWSGAVVAGLDEDTENSLSGEDADDLVHQYTGDNGELTVVAKQSGATTPSAMAVVTTPSMSRICVAGVVRQGKRYAVTSMLKGLAVATGERQAVAAFSLGEENHTYRARFTLTGRGGHVQTRIRQQTMKKGEFGVDLTVRDFNRLASFKRVSVRIVDLTDHKAKPTSYAIVR